MTKKRCFNGHFDLYFSSLYKINTEEKMKKTLLNAIFSLLMFSSFVYADANIGEKNGFK